MNKENLLVLILLTLLTAFTVFTVLDTYELHRKSQEDFNCPKGSTILESSYPTNIGEKTCIPIDNQTSTVNSSG